MLPGSHRLEVLAHSQVYYWLATIEMIVVMMMAAAEKHCYYYCLCLTKYWGGHSFFPFFHYFCSFFYFYLSYLFCLFIYQSILISNTFLLHVMLVNQLVIEPNRFYVYELKHSISR